jgi:DNA-binding NarL/FixJ family response regulator
MLLKTRLTPLGNLPFMHQTLTRREQEVANAIARGLSNREIAEELFLSTETVKRHLQTIYDKLEMRGRLKLALHLVRSAERKEGTPATS